MKDLKKEKRVRRAANPLRMHFSFQFDAKAISPAQAIHFTTTV